MTRPTTIREMAARLTEARRRRRRVVEALQLGTIVLVVLYDAGWASFQGTVVSLLLLTAMLAAMAASR